MILIASATRKLRQDWAGALKGSFAVCEVSCRAALEKCLSEQRYSVMLLHAALPELNGLQGVSDLHRKSPATRIILLTGAPDNREGVLALVLGVRGYCGEDIVPSLLVKAVRVVQQGEIWIGRKVIPDLLHEVSAHTQVLRGEAAPRVAGSLDGLSGRKLQVALLVGRGLCNKEISSTLSITESTVKAHLTAIFQKLGMTDRLRLALLVAEQHQTRNN